MLALTASTAGSRSALASPPATSPTMSTNALWMTLSTADAKPPRPLPRTPLTFAPPAPCRLLWRLRPPSGRAFPCQLRVERVGLCRLRLSGPSEGHFPWTEFAPASGAPPIARTPLTPSAGAASGLSDTGSCPDPAQPQMTSPLDRAAATSCTMLEAVVVLASFVVGEDEDIVPRAALRDHAGVTRTRGRPSALFTRSRLDHVDADRRRGTATAAAAPSLSWPGPERLTAGGRAPAAVAAGAVAAMLADPADSRSLYSDGGDRLPSLMLCFRDSDEGTNLLKSDPLCRRTDGRASVQTDKTAMNQTDRRADRRTGERTNLISMR